MKIRRHCRKRIIEPSLGMKIFAPYTSSISVNYDEPSFVTVDSRGHYSSFCETEIFNATCPPDHVIVMTHARYGRMKISRCVKMDYGHIGCSSDVLLAADSRCSGRRRCEIRVPDPEFARNKPCPDDLKPYLEAGFTCVKGRDDDICIFLFLSASFTIIKWRVSRNEPS